ncbi:putative DNA repair protein Rad26 [Aspergillus ruber CBS 135680]|uniref:Putative DNA repair protein Rad26 n=1 Tax=Aspergillus ruber (strain CBS 135680) TaxID=1388766 RepID=A0A017SRQ1_ASPRC|nr:putative DNA repair protein Rad26 [Aspergillus ruber CBS 135680]EYE99628.1 putative DNA repair protein Rad26 [Aspergillus ruber CBS 135680]
MDNHDEDFSDDGFDDLPPATLLQLEQSAYRSTQAQQQKPSLPPSAKPPEPPRTFTSRDIGQSGTANTNSIPSRLQSGLTNEYGNLDVGELDAEVFDDDLGSTSPLDQTMAFAEQDALQQQQGHIPVVDRGSRAYNPPADDYMDEDLIGDESGINDAYNSLMEKLAWENERNKQAMEELAAAKSLAETKAGEIAIIRSNQAKLAQNYDRQMATLRQSMEEEALKNKQDLEVLRAEGKMLATENAFLRQDLADEVMRTKDLKAKTKAVEKAPPMTPKKPKNLPFRDGFDDDEIIAVSPSKSAARSKQMTPVVPGKRKRQLSEGSPTKIQLSGLVREPAAEETPGALSDDAMLLDADVNKEQNQEPPPPPKEDINLRFMKRILDHRTWPNEERDLEVMASLTFPSEPERKLSSIVLEETARLELGNYVEGYARIIAGLWSRSLKEKFFTPIPMFMVIINFLLGMDMCSSIPGMIEPVVPVLQDSGDVNGVPRFKHSPVWRQNLGQIRQTPQSQLEHDVNSTEALRLLYRMVSGCLHLSGALDNFWRHIRYDFILMMLNCSQPIQDIILTLDLLITSIRDDTFGPIRATEADQIANENYIVDRVANLLSEMPQVDEGQEAYTKMEICNMRQEALSLLMAIAFPPMSPGNEHGSAVIANHPTVLARLIRAMHDELDSLYSYPPERDMHASLVNALMRLVYGVMQRHEGVDLQSKLGKVAGGKQKFIVVLTRLAFSEGLVLEEGIEDETVEMAHEMLDDAVNPQEAEALLEAFPSASKTE